MIETKIKLRSGKYSFNKAEIKDTIDLPELFHSTSEILRLSMPLKKELCKKYDTLFQGFSEINLDDFIKSRLERKNIIKGGKGDNLSVNYLLENYPKIDILNEINIGIKVEYEHKEDFQNALDIVFDHLAEFPDYYSRLIKFEKKADKYWKKRKKK